MFFGRRLLQAEYFDVMDRPAAEMAEGYELLRRMNRLFLLARHFKKILPRLFPPDRCRCLSILDLGAGDGSLGLELRHWAAARGWDWRITNLDLNLRAVQLNSASQCVVGSALCLPFREQSFDVVIASQMAHHIPTDDEVRRHFQEAWRVTRDVIFFNDLHRNPVLYAVLWLLLRLRRAPAHFCSDALLSVRRGWRVPEWRRLADGAGIPNARIWLYAGARVMLQARKGA